MKKKWMAARQVSNYGIRHETEAMPVHGLYRRSVWHCLIPVKRIGEMGYLTNDK